MTTEAERDTIRDVVGEALDDREHLLARREAAVSEAAKINKRALVLTLAVLKDAGHTATADAYRNEFNALLTSVNE